MMCFVFFCNEDSILTKENKLINRCFDLLICIYYTIYKLTHVILIIGSELNDRKLTLYFTIVRKNFSKPYKTLEYTIQHLYKIIYIIT